MRKLIKFLLRATIVAVLLLSFAVAGLAYWAYLKPRDLGKYMPQIESSINDILKNNTVKIGGAKLAFGGIMQPVYIDTKNVIILNKSKAQIASLKDMQFSYNLLDLLRAKLVPSQIKLVGAKVDTAEFGASDENALDLRDFDLSSLKAVELKDSTINISEMGEVWEIASVKLKFSGDNLSINGSVKPSGNEQITLAGKGNYKKGNYNVAAKVANLATARFAKIFPEVAGIDVIATGNMITELDKFKMAKIAADLTSLKGDVVSPKLRDKLQILGGNLNAKYDIITKESAINQANLSFADGTKINAAGYITAKHDIKLNAKIDKLAIENLHKYWPVDLGNNAIEWINLHLKNGVITNADAKVDIAGADIESGNVPPSALDLKFNVSNMDVNYVDDLLSVKSAFGSAVMNADTLKILINKGVIGGSSISNTNVEISEIGGIQEMLKVQGNINGDVRDIADFYIKLNKKRGRESLFASTQDVSGLASTKASLALPLIDDLKLEQVQFEIDSAISKASVKSEKISANNANIRLKLDDYGYEVKGLLNASIVRGKTHFANMPMGVNFKKYKDSTKLAINADITNSEIGVAELGVIKPKGEAGVLDFMIDNQQVKKLNLNSKSLKIFGAGNLNKDLSDIENFKISNFEGGGNKFSADVTNNGGYNVNIDAASLNVVPIIESISRQGAASSKESPAKIIINGKIAKMLFYHGEFVENAQIKISCLAACQNVAIKSGDIDILQTPTRLAVKSGDAGKILKMLDAYDNMEGGKLEIEAKGDGKGGYDGVISVQDFNIQKAKILTKILTVGSLTGIADIMQGKGISFKKLKTKFSKDDNEVKISDFRMFGSAIGVTTDGTLNRKTNKLDFQGKIIPSYTANTLLGKIPVLGDIIIGQEGVFAFAYSVKGTSEDPDVFVNPLSVLAPGFLQEIFQ